MTLLELQRRMAGAIMAPLGPGDHIAPKAPNGRGMRTEAAEIVKPNDRLSSMERLEIYARSYWFRVLDSLHDDYPGLRAIIGPRAFDRLSRAYLAELPSQSYTLRDLGSRLEGWIEAHPEFAGKNLSLALDMVRLEWAHTVAFDGPAEKVLGPEDLLDLSPEMTFRVQPYISLLALQYPVDDLRLQVSDISEGHGEASNAVLRHKERRAVRRHSLKAERIFLVVHRREDSVYYRRWRKTNSDSCKHCGTEPPVADALDSVFADSDISAEDLQGKIQDWFSAWSQNGWFCHSGGKA